MNRLKVILANKGNTYRWLALELGKTKPQFHDGVQMRFNLLWKRYTKSSRF